MSAEAQLTALERRVLRDVSVRAFTAAVTELRTALALESPDTLARLLAIAPPDVHDALVAAIVEAHRLGIDDAIAILTPVTGNRTLTEAQLAALRVATPPEAHLAAARTLAESLAADIAKARTLANAGVEVRLASAPILAADDRLRRGVTTAVVTAGNRGVLDVTRTAGVPVVWVAETDACVHCLAYSGRVADPGANFPGGLTYGAKSYYPDPLPAPPLHPNCRCSLEPLLSSEYADALRREADRSVLRGFSLPSESMGVRIDAARRLVANDVSAPASVIAYARRAIKAGTFATRGR